MPTSVVDLFCGVGGMTHGFRKEGFAVAAGIDIDETCRYAYEANNDATFVTLDIATATPDDVISLYPENHTRILIGCAPCQPFSKYTNPKAVDDKWRLLHHFADIVEGVQPDVVSMENVPLLTRHAVFRTFVRRLERMGYDVTHFLARGVEYGIPQRRVRLVLFASVHGPVELIPPTHAKKPRTVRDAIGHLEPLAAGEVSARDRLHQTRGLSEINLRRIRATTAGGGWGSWDPALRLECHKKKSGQSFRSVYGRMSWDEPSPVITTQCLGLGNGRFGHPEQDRAISLREAAILQTFPRSYKLIKPRAKISQQDVARQLGNAVPVRLGRIVARSIARHLEAAGVDT